MLKKIRNAIESRLYRYEIKESVFRDISHLAIPHTPAVLKNNNSLIRDSTIITLHSIMNYVIL